MLKNKYILLFVMAVINMTAFCQQAEDTLALITEFKKVMSFTTQQYMHYETITKLSAEPVIESIDTMSIKGEFFKNGTEIYSNNQKEELYMQDSFMVDINNDRKTIWISKVDVSSKEKMNILPLHEKALSDMFKKNFHISKSKINADIYRISFKERIAEYSTSSTSTSITLEYSVQSFLPNFIEIEINLKQPVDEAMIVSLKEEGYDELKLIKEFDGKKYLIRKQVMKILFKEINNEKEHVVKMPSYKDCFEFDLETQEYKAKGFYSGYEITKTF